VVSTGEVGVDELLALDRRGIGATLRQLRRSIANVDSSDVRLFGGRLKFDRSLPSSARRSMEIIDAQVHTWMSDRPRRPWVSSYRVQHRDTPAYLLHAGQTNSTEMALTEMAEVGVDRAVLSPNGVYGTDNSYEFEGAARYPSRFRVLGWVDHQADDVEEQLAANFERGMVGVRLTQFRDRDRLERGEFDRALAVCEKQSAVVSVMVFHPLPDVMIETIERYEGITWVLGHLGLGFAPPVLGVLPEDPFENLPAVLDLARLANMHVALTGAPSLSREPFPFRDLWSHIKRIVDSYGPDRLMWGSDYTRCSGLHSYWDGTHYLSEVDGLSADDLTKIYGATLRRVYKWDHRRPR
jgi:L-fuconolactonase